MSRFLDVVSRIGDKLIRDTPFRYRLEVAPVRQRFGNETGDGLQCVDFGRTFGLGRPAVAYAFTQIVAHRPVKETIELEHNDACTIWLNGEVVFQRTGDRDIRLDFEERSLRLSDSFEVSLRQGINDLLVRSETRGTQWRVYLQPPSLNGAIRRSNDAPEIGLRQVPDLDSRVAELTNWLVLGPFARSEGQEPLRVREHGVRFGEMYPGLDGPVTWTIPKIEVLGALISEKPWGTNYTWNYHNGGVAWAMQHLGDVTGEPSFSAYANQFCDFHLKGMPFVRHQVRTLNAVDSANHFIIDTPLLDFTLAPSLPFVHRLRREADFSSRQMYVEFVERMIKYAVSGQIRLPGEGIYTRTTPLKYTTWADDMFMGIPFLVQAALYSPDPQTRQRLLDDAAHQTLAFNTQVWDEDAQLYMHARYFGRDLKLPHWSRANGWPIWAMTEVLTQLPPQHEHWGEILAHFRRHAEGLRRWQDKDGFWRNVLDRSDSAQEVSGTAIFVMALARGVTNGWLDPAVFSPVVERGWEAIESRIDADGTVHDICAGTMCSEDVEYYMNRPFYDNDTHGVFAVLFAGIAVDQMMSHSRNRGEERRNEKRIGNYAAV